MELLLTITLSDRLFSLLEDKLPNLNRRVEKALTKELDSQVRSESSITVKVSAAPSKDAQPQPDAPQPQAEVTASQPEAAAEPTAQDVREAIDKTRLRIEGDDYMTNPSSEKRKKYHKALGDLMKQIATTLGAEKPSMLAADRRAAFIAECDNIRIDDNGNLSTPSPF